MSNELPANEIADRVNKLFNNHLIRFSLLKTCTQEESINIWRTILTISDKPKETPAATTTVSQPQPVVNKEYENRKKEMIERFSQHYEINPQLASRIQILEDYELVILCDDSGSMNTPIHGTTTNRWDELREMVHVVVDIYAAFDADGVDVYFLK